MSIESLRIRIRDWLNAPTKEEAAELAALRADMVALRAQLAKPLRDRDFHSWPKHAQETFLRTHDELLAALDPDSEGALH